MTLKVVTNISTLMGLAAKVGDAKKNGTSEDVTEAEAELRDYEKIVLNSDELSLNMTNGQMSELMKSGPT